MFGVLLRDAGAGDVPFLLDMLFEACFADEDPKPSRAILDEPNLAHYVSDWGRSGDRALVAEIAGEPAGAAWYRLFAASDRGYGFVDEATPELTIAVAPAHRGRGLGGALLEGLLDAATADGFAALSLSVAPANERALTLYERSGFRVVADDDPGGSLTMLASLSGRRDAGPAEA